MENFVVSARKYRPTGFEEVVGQEHITTTLKNAIDNQKLAQALLFCGPRGVGKTTCARIVARMINQFDESVTNALNIFELDAASNNSVEDIRNLIDQVRYPPQFGKYKVYIIDEVHMLSNAAFNAFLKTLEEPPPYAIFILATTEKHKVIPTILSRCQIYDFKRIQLADIAGYLKKIGEKEGLPVEDEALYLIAQKADGALRDALSIFDLIVTYSSGKGVTFDDVLKNLHILDYDYYFKVVDALLSKNHSIPLVLFDEILREGFDGHNFINGLAEHFRHLLVSQDSRTVQLLEVPESIRNRYAVQAADAPDALLLSWLNIANQCDIVYKSSKNPRLTVELALMKMAHVGSFVHPEEISQTAEVKKKTPADPVTTGTAVEVPVTPSPSKPVSTPPAEPIPKPVRTPAAATSTSSNGIKKQTLDIGKALASAGKKEEAIKAGSDAPLADKKVTDEMLKTSWNEMLETLKDRPAVYQVLAQDFKRKEDDIILTLSNPVQESLIAPLRSELDAFLRTRLNNSKIRVTWELGQVNHEQLPYGSREKFEHLMKKNPALKDLKERFNLDPDFD